MKKTSIGGRVYKDSSGAFWLRPVVNGCPTWRKLHSINAKDARGEGAELLRASSLSKLGVGKCPFSPVSTTIGSIIDAYLAAGCPDKRFAPQRPKTQADYAGWLENARKYFGGMDPDAIRLKAIHEYAGWRRRQGFQFGSGDRTIDLEMTALSSALTYAVLKGVIEHNFLRSGRPRLHQSANVIHASACMPASGDELNRIACWMMAEEKNESFGWQFCFAALMGLRSHELLLLRVDAKPGEPGFIAGDRVDVRRGKAGINPWVLIHPDLARAIQCHRQWRIERGIQNPFWFPKFASDGPVRKTGLSDCLHDACLALGIPKRKPHGCRAFYATKWHRDGFSDSDVASLLGDKTVSLMHQVYGAPRPGEPTFSFRPSEGPAAWDRWAPLESTGSQLQVVDRKAHAIQFPTQAVDNPMGPLSLAIRSA